MEQYINNILCSKVISINSKGLEIDKLCEINERISYNDNIKLILSCDYGVTVPNGTVNNLEILRYLDKITRLVIFNHSSMPLSNIDNVSHIYGLTEFTLSGFIHQRINLDILSRYNLNLLDLDLNPTLALYQLRCKVTTKKWNTEE